MKDLNSKWKIVKLFRHNHKIFLRVWKKKNEYRSSQLFKDKNFMFYTNTLFVKVYGRRNL